MFMPALHQRAHFARPVIIIVCRANFWVSLLITFLLSSEHRSLSSLWKLTRRPEVSKSVPACFLHVPWLKYMVSSATGSYLQVLEGNQNSGNSLSYVWDLWDATDKTSKRGQPCLVLGLSLGILGEIFSLYYRITSFKESIVIIFGWHFKSP